MTRFDLTEVEMNLRPADILDRYGCEAHRTGAQFRVRECPNGCSGESEALSISADVFYCHRCKAAGNLLKLVALFEGLDIKRNFPKVLTVAAEIAGVAPEALNLDSKALEEKNLIRQRWKEETALRRLREESQKLENSLKLSAAFWESCETHHSAGEAYLASRGLSAALHSEIVRFSRDGDVCVPVFDFKDRFVNVVRRHTPQAEAKLGRRFSAIAGCIGKGFYGDPASISKFTGGVLICEGLMDYLSARVLYPSRAAFGARNAAGIPQLTHYVARKIWRSHDRKIVAVPHHDKAGKEAMANSRLALRALGFPPARAIVLDTSSKGDLNDWLCAQ